MMAAIFRIVGLSINRSWKAFQNTIKFTAKTTSISPKSIKKQLKTLPLQNHSHEEVRGGEKIYEERIKSPP